MLSCQTLLPRSFRTLEKIKVLQNRYNFRACDLESPSVTLTLNEIELNIYDTKIVDSEKVCRDEQIINISNCKKGKIFTNVLCTLIYLSWESKQQNCLLLFPTSKYLNCHKA